MIKHKLSFCSLCAFYMYRCGACGNNSCNGGYGVVNGESCKDCPEAYRLASLDNNKFRRLVEWTYHTKRYIFRRIGNAVFNLKENVK